MKLLFNNSEELKKYLPYVDADITFDNIVLDATNSTKKICKLIGTKLYLKICEHYENSRSEFQNLIDAVAYPIAVDAYRIYVLNNDLAHTNAGRRMRVSENEKQAFEWMIDRDNKNLERRFYTALDNLIEVLDEENPEINPTKKWKDSIEFEQTFTHLFRTTDEFNEYFEIESLYLLIKLIPGIKKCLIEEIIPRMTQERWNIYIDALKKSEDVPDSEILYHIKGACAYYALSWASTRLSATIFPEGVLQNNVSERQTTQAKKVPETNQFGVLKIAFLQDFKTEVIKLENLLKPKPIQTNECIDYDFGMNENDKIIDI